jgi:DNA-binding MarR family transcriptional regulator
MNDGLYDPENIELETSVGFYLTKARQALLERLDRALEPLDLTAQQIGVILLLSRGYARTPFELSRKMAYDSGSMTRMLDRLEAKGLVARVRSSEDRRVVNLELTREGREAARQIPAVLCKVQNAFLQGLSVEEWKQLKVLLQRILDNGQALQATTRGNE